jgi:hypothetical protein
MASLNLGASLSNNTVADATVVQSMFNNVKTFVESALVQADGSVKAGTTSIDYTSVPQTTVSTSDPTGGKNGDIWVKVV